MAFCQWTLYFLEQTRNKGGKTPIQRVFSRKWRNTGFSKHRKRGFPKLEAL